MSDALRLVLLLKLLLATILGGAISFEREIAGKPAGLRTNILICVGAGVFLGYTMWGDAATLKKDLSATVEQVNTLKKDRPVRASN